MDTLFCTGNSMVKEATTLVRHSSEPLLSGCANATPLHSYTKQGKKLQLFAISKSSLMIIIVKSMGSLFCTRNSKIKEGSTLRHRYWVPLFNRCSNATPPVPQHTTREEITNLGQKERRVPVGTEDLSLRGCATCTQLLALLSNRAPSSKLLL